MCRRRTLSANLLKNFFLSWARDPAPFSLYTPNISTGHAAAKFSRTGSTMMHPTSPLSVLSKQYIDKNVAGSCHAGVLRERYLGSGENLRTSDCQTLSVGKSKIICSNCNQTCIPVKTRRMTSNGTTSIRVILGCRRYTRQGEEARPPGSELPPGFLAPRYPSVRSVELNNKLCMLKFSYVGKCRTSLSQNGSLSRSSQSCKAWVLHANVTFSCPDCTVK